MESIAPSRTPRARESVQRMIDMVIDYSSQQNNNELGVFCYLELNRIKFTKVRYERLSANCTLTTINSEDDLVIIVAETT